MARVTLKSRFPEIIGSMPRRISADLKDGAENIAERARQNIDRGDPDSPHIRDSIEVSGGAGEYKVSAGGGDAYYAQWVEFGRKNAPPYPFFIPAAEEEALPLLAKVTETLNSL